MNQMEMLIGHLKATLIVVGAAVAAVLAPVAWVLTGLVALQLLDLLSALVANGRRRRIDPDVGWYGWRRKANTVLVVLALTVLQHFAAGEGLPSLPAAQFVGGGFCVVEFFSVLRNARLSGVRLPRFLDAVFAKAEGEVLGQEPAAHG